MSSSKASRLVAAAALAWAMIGAPNVARSQVAETPREPPPGSELWDAGANWISMRAGYAKSTAPGAGAGGVGYGFGFAHMLSPLKVWRWTLFKRFSIGGYVHHEVIDHFLESSQIEVPATLELVRHINWSTPLKPYVGFGGGPFYRKAYRTGADTRNVSLGGYLTVGANAPIGGRHLIGVDTRWIRVDSSYIPPNPVFGPGTAEERVTAQGTQYERKPGTHWSAKVTYTVVY